MFKQFSAAESSNIYSEAAARALRTRDAIDKVFAPMEQWVANVTGFSTQYDTSGWSAKNVEGEPKVYPQYGDNNGAWAQSDCSENEYIELHFAKPVYVERVDIYETYNAGAVVRLMAYTTNKEWVTLWQANAPQRIEKSRIFSPLIQTPAHKSSILRLDLNCCASDSSAWCEIDAVKLVGKAVYLEPPPPASQVGQSYRPLVNCKDFSDVSLRVENKLIPAHRVILAARSQYFRTAFSQSPNKKEFDISNVCHTAMLGVLQYIYTGDLDSNVSAEQLVDIIRASCQLDVAGCAALCNCYLVAELTPRNVLHVYKAASQQPILASTRTVCQEFIRENFAAIAQCPDFASLPQNLMVEITQIGAGALNVN